MTLLAAHEDRSADTPRHIGRYHLLSLLGTGGTARVYHAEQRGPSGFRRSVALKVLDPGPGNSSGEAWLAAQTSHPNLVTLYDYGRAAGHEYLVMELIDGPTLGAHLKRVGPPQAAVAVRIGLDLCSAIEYLHALSLDGVQAGLVHRDVKPSNVLLGRGGAVKLTDLGIAKATALATEHTATGITKGTPAYMSPEQLRGAPIDARSDLFSLGVLLTELFTGRRLFEGRTSAEVMINIAAVGVRLNDPSFPAGVEEVVPGLRALLRRCLQPAAEDRPAAAGDVADELRRLLSPADREEVAAWIELDEAAPRTSVKLVPKTLAMETPSLPSRAIGPLGTLSESRSSRGLLGAPTARAWRGPVVVLLALTLFALGVFVGTRVLDGGPSQHGHSTPLHHERGEVVVSIGSPAVVTAHAMPGEVQDLRVLYRPPGGEWTSAPMRQVSQQGDWSVSIDTAGASAGALSYYFRGGSPAGTPVSLGGPEHPWSIQLRASPGSPID